MLGYLFLDSLRYGSSVGPVVLLLLFTVFTSGVGQELIQPEWKQPVGAFVSGSVSLPGIEETSVKNIVLVQWRFSPEGSQEGKIILEFCSSNIATHIELEAFKNRVHFNKKDLSITIRDLSISDTGYYTRQIHSPEGSHIVKIPLTIIKKEVDLYERIEYHQVWSPPQTEVEGATVFLPGINEKNSDISRIMWGFRSSSHDPAVTILEYIPSKERYTVPANIPYEGRVQFNRENFCLELQASTVKDSGYFTLEVHSPRNTRFYITPVKINDLDLICKSCHSQSSKPEMTADQVVAFKADNGHFWSVVNKHYGNKIEAARSSLDASCQFLVSPASSGKIYIRTPQNKYLSRIHRGGLHYIEPAYDQPNIYCEFQLLIQDCKMVLKADNGMYLSRIHWLGFPKGTDNIEAAKKQIDMFCQFEVLKYEGPSLGILELFLNTGVGVSFRADNGHFWSVVDYGEGHVIEAADSIMGPSAKFLMERGSAGKIVLKTPQNKYLCRILHDDIDYIKAAKDAPDDHCEFLLLFQDCKMALKADNGKFLSPIRRGIIDNIEAAKLNLDVFCQFEVVPYSG